MCITTEVVQDSGPNHRGWAAKMGFHTILDGCISQPVEWNSWHGMAPAMWAWKSGCRNMVYVSLDKFYSSITFLEPRLHDGYGSRLAMALDLSKRPLFGGLQPETEKWEELISSSPSPSPNIGNFLVPQLYTSAMSSIHLALNFSSKHFSGFGVHFFWFALTSYYVFL